MNVIEMPIIVSTGKLAARQLEDVKLKELLNGSTLLKLKKLRHNIYCDYLSISKRYSDIYTVTKKDFQITHFLYVLFAC